MTKSKVSIVVKDFEESKQAETCSEYFSIEYGSLFLPHVPSIGVYMWDEGTGDALRPASAPTHPA